MTRPKNIEAAEQERRIIEALEGVKMGRYKSYREAANAMDVSKSTLCARANGIKPRRHAHENEQLLTSAEEKELARWISQLTTFGYPPKPYGVREMAEAIRSRRVHGVNNSNVIYVSYDQIGEQWVKRFMERHQELSIIMPEQIEAARIKESSRSVLEQWFHDVKAIIDEYGILPCNIYNMDETGYSIGSIKATRVIIDKTKNLRYSAYPGRQEWVSVIECISMDGRVLLPLIIFKGKSVSGKWIPPHTPKDWLFSANTEGWTSNQHSKKWLLENFEPHTQEMAQGHPRLLIFDGHGSHTTSDIIRHCIENQIQLALLPPHTSHLTQPLDIGVFSSVKAHMTRELDRYFRTGIPRIEKAEWLDAFITARSLAFTKRNILSGWSGTGLYPFNPEKVLSRVPIVPAIELCPPRLATPEIDNPLDNPNLTSSPIETPAMDAANLHLQQRASDQSISLDTPRARTHIVRLIHTLKRSLAENRIQSQQLSELHNIITTHKQRQSGKYQILRGTARIATPDMLQRIENAEAQTKSRKSKLQKTTHPTTPVPQTLEKTLNSNSLDLDSDDDMLDCIVVALE